MPARPRCAAAAPTRRRPVTVAAERLRDDLRDRARVSRPGEAGRELPAALSSHQAIIACPPRAGRRPLPTLVAGFKRRSTPLRLARLARSPPMTTTGKLMIGLRAANLAVGSAILPAELRMRRAAGLSRFRSGGPPTGTAAASLARARARQAPAPAPAARPMRQRSRVSRRYRSHLDARASDNER